MLMRLALAPKAVEVGEAEVGEAGADRDEAEEAEVGEAGADRDEVEEAEVVGGVLGERASGIRE